jgi:hypothetical protein
LHAFDVDLAAVAAQQRRDPPPSQGSGRQFQNPNLRSTDYSDSADYERFTARSFTDFPVQGPEQKVPSIAHLICGICAICGFLVRGLSRSTDYSDSADYERFAARSLTDFPVQGPEQKVPSIVHLTGVICAISGSLVWGLSNGSHNAGVVRSVQDLLIQFERAGSLARKQVKSRTC